MQNQSLRLQQFLTLMVACAVISAGCHARQCYTARVIGGPVQPIPVAPLPPTPAPTLPPAHVHVPAPAEIQPLPGDSRPLIPAVPQPVSPAVPTPIQSNFPPVSSGIVLEKVGPSQALVGGMVTYRLEVQAGSGGARDVTVSDQLAAGLTFASSTPMATVQPNTLEWRLGDLRGGELRTIEVNFRAEQSGVFNNCAVARSIDGQTSQDCLSTAVLVSDLEVRVTVAGSDTVMIGDRVTFQITVTNRSSQPADGLLITDHFDEGLAHDVAANPIEKDLGQLAGGQSTTIGVTFRAIHAGRLCNRVEVRGASGVRGTAEGCVTAILPTPATGTQQPAPPIVLPPPPTTGNPPSSPSSPNVPTPQTIVPPAAQERPLTAARPGLEVKISGPGKAQQVDAVAEFNIEVLNNGDVPLTNVHLTVGSDAALFPVQATDGYEWDDAGNLIWKFPSLAAGKSLRLQLNHRCRNLAAKACLRVRVSTKEGAADDAEGCVEIRRGESQLGMTVLDLADPVSVGKDLTYEIRVTNAGTAPARNVAVLIVAPPEMSIIPLGTMGDKTTYGVDGQNVRFKPVAEMQPGEKLTFRVRVRAQKAGDVMLEAILSSEGMSQPMSVKEQTTVVAAGE